MSCGSQRANRDRASISKMKTGKAAGLQKLALQQVDINEMKFGFMLVCATTNAIFILRQLQEKFLAKKKILTLTLYIWRKFLVECLRMLYTGL